jgi:ArsR family transcriptional regulator
MQLKDNGNPATSELTPVFKIHAELCKGLANEHRLAILYALASGEMCVTDIAAEIGMSIHSTSQHLRKLSESLLLESRRQGKSVYYRIANEKYAQGCALIRQALVEQQRAKGQSLLAAELIDAVQKITVPGSTGESIVDTVG